MRKMIKLPRPDDPLKALIDSRRPLFEDKWKLNQIPDAMIARLVQYLKDGGYA